MDSWTRNCFLGEDNVDPKWPAVIWQYKTSVILKFEESRVFIFSFLWKVVSGESVFEPASPGVGGLSGLCRLSSGGKG